jgi:hypothetical protein
MRRLLLASTLLALGCGSSARPADIPPVAPDFARGGEADPLVAFGDDDDGDHYDDEEGFGAFGTSKETASDGADAATPGSEDPAVEHEDASAEQPEDPSVEPDA